MAAPIIKIKAKAKNGDGKRRTIINLWEDDDGKISVSLSSKDGKGFNPDYDMDFVEFAKRRADFYLDAYRRDDGPRGERGGGRKASNATDEGAGDFD